MRQRFSRAVVVGANGFIGRHVVTQLVQDGIEVTALDLETPADERPGVDWSAGSINDEAFLAAAVEGVDSVVFLAGSSLPASGNDDLAAEISGHVRVVVRAAEICCAQRVGQFIFASSGGTVYGTDSSDPITESTPTRPRNAYGASKLAIEHYLGVLSHLRGMRTVSLRISNPYGEGQRADRGQGFVAAAMAAAFRRQQLNCWGDGSTVRDFVYVGDVARAVSKACSLGTTSTVLNIGSGAGNSLREVVELVEEITGIDIDILYHPERAIDVKTNVLDVSRAREVLDWGPEISIREGIRRTAEWWAAQQP